MHRKWSDIAVLQDAVEKSGTVLQDLKRDLKRVIANSGIANSGIASCGNSEECGDQMSVFSNASSRAVDHVDGGQAQMDAKATGVEKVLSEASTPPQPNSGDVRDE